MVGEQLTRVKARRKGGEKSKTGCLTCRIRHVKCDESKPACRRCTSTGRQCEGPVSYTSRFAEEGSRQPAPTTRIHVLESPSKVAFTLTSPVFKGREHRSFDFYLTRAAPALAGSLDPYFWEHLVPQLSQSEPVIRRAVLAISSLFEYPHTIIPPQDIEELGPVTDRNHRQALDWYNSAIFDFNKHMQQTSESITVALISCILFICIELQQDGLMNALTLLDKGLALHSSTLAAKGTAYDRMSIVDETIARFFSRLAIQASVFGREPPPAWPIPAINRQALDTRLSSFQTLQEARCLQFILRDDVHRILRQASSEAQDDLQVRNKLYESRQALISKLEEWQISFEKISCTSQESVRASSILSVVHESLYILAESHLDPYQTAFDKHLKRFERIITLAEVALEPGSSDIPFQFDGGLLLPLHYVAVKCRHPVIRRQALSLLRRCPSRECWSKTLPHVWMAERAIAVEEQYCGRLVEFPGAYGKETQTLVDESKRLYTMEVLDESKPGDPQQFSLKPGRYLDMPI